MTDSTDNALKPCPFCGGDNLSFSTYDIEGWVAHVECNSCDDMIGPMSAYKYDTQSEAEADASAVWNRRADLAPDPLGDPRVWELVESVEDGIKAGLLPKTSASEGGAAKYSAQVRAADRLRAALAALSPTGGNDD